MRNPGNVGRQALGISSCRVRCAIRCRPVLGRRDRRVADGTFRGSPRPVRGNARQPSRARPCRESRLSSVSTCYARGLRYSIPEWTRRNVPEPRRELGYSVERTCGPLGNESSVRGGAPSNWRPPHVDRGSGRRRFALHNRNGRQCPSRMRRPPPRRPVLAPQDRWPTTGWP